MLMDLIMVTSLIAMVVTAACIAYSTAVDSIRQGHEINVVVSQHPPTYQSYIAMFLLVLMAGVAIYSFVSWAFDKIKINKAKRNIIKRMPGLTDKYALHFASRRISDKYALIEQKAESFASVNEKIPGINIYDVFHVMSELEEGKSIEAFHLENGKIVRLLDGVKNHLVYGRWHHSLEVFENKPQKYPEEKKNLSNLWPGIELNTVIFNRLCSLTRHGWTLHEFESTDQMTCAFLRKDGESMKLEFTHTPDEK